MVKEDDVKLEIDEFNLLGIEHSYHVGKDDE